MANVRLNRLLLPAGVLLAAVALFIIYRYGSWLNVYLGGVVAGALIYFLYANNTIERRIESPEQRKKAVEGLAQQGISPSDETVNAELARRAAPNIRRPHGACSCRLPPHLSGYWLT